jgi:hypothetical protein
LRPLAGRSVSKTLKYFEVVGNMERRERRTPNDVKRSGWILLNAKVWYRHFGSATITNGFREDDKDLRNPSATYEHR